MPFVIRRIPLAACLLLAAAPLAATAPAARTVTINFRHLAGADGSPFARYHENGFTVTARHGSNWLNGKDFGDPAPYIYFNTPANTQQSGSVRITSGGATFGFKSVDVYSSITDIPYVFRGSLKGATVFKVTGTVPNTFGAFANVPDPDGGDAIDTLEITLTNPAVCCENPMGLDNIKLVPKNNTR